MTVYISANCSKNRFTWMAFKWHNPSTLPELLTHDHVTLGQTNQKLPGRMRSIRENLVWTLSLIQQAVPDIDRCVYFYDADRYWERLHSVVSHAAFHRSSWHFVTMQAGAISMIMYDWCRTNKIEFLLTTQLATGIGGQRFDPRACGKMARPIGANQKRFVQKTCDLMANEHDPPGYVRSGMTWL